MTGFILQLESGIVTPHDICIDNDPQITSYDCIYKKKAKYMVQENTFQTNNIKFGNSNRHDMLQHPGILEYRLLEYHYNLPTQLCCV
ncbi:putative orfan [Tupanvirus soda lake]|uniref:Orfan n=2 Tax=Tupanvirus TaxID=2094720 RepID=A0AC62AC64_9VIRU|nr:putative orfan [Tupanvirus soda lake]QKU35375.1 putative orfan [Tupanvirus soda lake]